MWSGRAFCPGRRSDYFQFALFSIFFSFSMDDEALVAPNGDRSLEQDPRCQDDAERFAFARETDPARFGLTMDEDTLLREG